MQFYFGFIRAGVDDRYYVEPVLYVSDIEQAPVNTRGAGDDALFAEIDVAQRACEIGGGTRLDLDETERVAIESDDVDLALDLSADIVAADGRGEVRGNDAVTLAFEKLHGEVLAALPEFARRLDRRDYFLLFPTGKLRHLGVGHWTSNRLLNPLNIFRTSTIRLA